MKLIFSIKQLAALACAAGVGFGTRAFLAPLYTPPSDATPRPIPLSEPISVNLDKPSQEEVPKIVDEALKDASIAGRSRKLRRLWERLSPSDYPIAMSRLRRAGFDWTQWLLETELVGQWAKSDPRAALAWLEAHDGVSSQFSRSAVITAWAETNPTEALQWAETLPKRRRQSTVVEIIGAVAGKSPDEGIAMLKSRPELMTPVTMGVFSIFMSITAEDPRKAIEAALAFPEGGTRTEALRSIASTWVGSDAKAALSWIKELPPGELRSEALQNAIDSLSWQEPETAARLAMDELAPGRELNSRVSNALRGWGGKDPAAARKWLKGLPEGAARQQGTQAMIGQWATSEPAAAMNYAIETSDVKERTILTASVLSEWFQHDEQEAHRWMQENPASASPEVLHQTFNALSDSSPAQAAQLASLLPEGKKREDGYEKLALSWARYDVAAAEKWMEALPAGAARDRFFKGMIAGLAESNLATASNRVGQLPEGTLKEDGFSAVASAWAKVDAPAALEWVGEAAPSAAQEKTVGEIIKTWARSDIDSTSDWLNTLASGSLRDTAIKSFSSTITSNDPQSAAIWATSISEETVRKTTLSAVVKQWIASDGDAARAWVQSASIPSEWKDAWLKK